MFRGLNRNKYINFAHHHGDGMDNSDWQEVCKLPFHVLTFSFVQSRFWGCCCCWCCNYCASLVWLFVGSPHHTCHLKPYYHTIMLKPRLLFTICRVLFADVLSRATKTTHRKNENTQTPQKGLAIEIVWILFNATLGTSLLSRDFKNHINISWRLTKMP